MCVWYRSWSWWTHRTERRGGGVQKLKTPNVYYYPVCSRLAFRGESPAVTLGPTAELPLRSTPSFLLPPRICGPKCWKENKRIQRNNIWGHLSWGCHSGNSGGFWGNILLFFYYGREWETSEKHTSQLFSSKSRSRVIKVDAPPKFYSLPLSFPPFLHSSYLPSLPHSFPSPPSFFLPLGSGGSLLPVGTVDNKHPHPATLLHLGAGNPIHTHLHGLPWQRGPSVHQTNVWKNLF